MTLLHYPIWFSLDVRDGETAASISQEVKVWLALIEKDFQYCTLKLGAVELLELPKGSCTWAVRLFVEEVELQYLALLVKDFEKSRMV